MQEFFAPIPNPTWGGVHAGIPKQSEVQKYYASLLFKEGFKVCIT